MRRTILTVIILSWAGLLSAREGTIRLRGKIEGMPSPVTMSYNGAAGMLGDSRRVMIATDSQGCFDTVLPLDRPGYYSIIRNTLWLSPGDDMVIFLTARNDHARFLGRGAQANEYLKYRLFPKSGSYLNSGKGTGPDFASTRRRIDSLASLRRAELEALDGVSDDFKALERARISADVVNSYLSYPGFAKEYASLPPDSAAVRAERLFAGLAPEVRRRIACLTDERYLDVAVVRDVLLFSRIPGYRMFFEGITLPARTCELVEAYSLRRKLAGTVTSQTVVRVREFVAGMTQPDFKHEMELQLRAHDLLAGGNPAPDLEITGMDGIPKMLSAYKGRVICVDVWATWCAPCIREAPQFEALARRFEGLPVVFLQISIDSKADTWKNFLKNEPHPLPQYLARESDLKEKWMLNGVPRFILIDGGFNIIDADAPWPSSGHLERLIEQALLPPSR